METSFFSNNFKKYILLFPLGILIGAVLMNFAGVSKINEWGLFNKELERVPSFFNVFKIVTKERIGHFVIIFLICFSTVKESFIYFLVGWIGLMMGMLQSVLIIQYGFWGVVCYILVIGLHSMIYFLATMGLLAISEKGKEKVISVSMLLVLLSCLIGIFIEVLMSWMGLFLMSKYVI